MRAREMAAEARKLAAEKQARDRVDADRRRRDNEESQRLKRIKDENDRTAREKSEREAEERRVAEELRRLEAERLLRERQEQESLDAWLKEARIQGMWFTTYRHQTYQWDPGSDQWEAASDKVAAALSVAINGHHTYVRIAGRYYIYIEAHGSWRPSSPYERRCIDHASQRGGRPWFDGPIVSRNYGCIIVPPFIKSDGTPVNGHTKNRPGEGPARPRTSDILIEDPERHERDTARRA